MNLQIGTRKALGFVGLVLAVVAGLVAWLLFGTTGLLLVLIATSVAAPLAIGWFVVQAERRTAIRISNMRDAVARALQSQQNRLDDIVEDLDEFTSRAVWDGERAERFLTTLDARLIRTERMQEALVERLDEP